LKVLLVDNYDSFTFNLSHLLEGLDADVWVVRNDEITEEQIVWCEKVVLSPGPGVPLESLGMMDVLKKTIGKKPILGVCLGMQALAEYFDDEIYNLDKVYHGVQKKIKVEKGTLFKGLSLELNVALYHSWAVSLNDNSVFDICAVSEDNVLMAIEHKELPVFGIQFHPESILTPEGRLILKNFLDFAV